MGLRFWNSIPPYARTTFILIIKYTDRPDRRTRCFTYKGLRNYLSYNREARGKFEWHTIERGVRKLAEEGYLKRVRKGKIVIFCPGDKFNSLLWDYKKILGGVKEEGGGGRAH